MLGFATLFSASLWLGANAHVCAWHKGMYCLNGNTGKVDLNSYAIVYPLYQLNFNDWWFHHVDGCDNYPPAAGDFLELPAGGSFTVEIASNQAKTTLSYGGIYTSDWPDGNHYPDNYNVPSCIISPNLHAQNQSRAAGTVFAISYESDIKKVTPDNLTVFTVRYNTPWKRVQSYDVPAAMPPCPPGGCICAWGWVPNGCGQPNMYHQPFKCQVTGSTSNTPIAAPKPPVWCEGNPGGCTKGAKQMVYWNQNSGNNVYVTGWDLSGEPKSPGYNSKMGFSDGAQNDIFSGTPSTSGGSSSPVSGSSGSSGNSGNSGNPYPVANPNVSTTSTPAAARPTSGTPTPNNGTTAQHIPNNAPSCKKRPRSRRSVAIEDVNLVKKSNLVGGPAHRRHARRNW